LKQLEILDLIVRFKNIWSVCAITGLSLAYPFLASAQSDWGYTGSIGPEYWGDIKKKYLICKVGRLQSPVDLRNVSVQKSNPIHFMYEPFEMSLHDNGHTLIVDTGESGSVRIGPNRFELLQFHFHAPSEHLKEGIAYPMEIHFVHKDDKGNLAVLGLLVKEGAANPFIDQVWNSEKTTGEVFNPYLLLPGDRSYFHYIGSLTTPPCSENVNWNVFVEPIELSKGQIDFFRTRYTKNARPVQRLFNRKISSY